MRRFLLRYCNDFSVIRVEGLVETRTEEKESSAPRSGQPPRLCRGQNAQRRMGNRTESDSDHHDNFGTPCKPRIRIPARLLFTSAPRTNVHGLLLYILNRRIRN